MIDDLPGASRTEDQQLQRLAELENTNASYAALMAEQVEAAELTLQKVRSVLSEVATDRMQH